MNKQMESYNFCEFSIGQYHSNDIFQLSDIKGFEGKTDVYMSMFRFSKDFQDYVNKTKSVSNYPGNISMDFIYFDFDCLESIQKAKGELINFIENVLGQYLVFDEFEQVMGQVADLLVRRPQQIVVERRRMRLVEVRLAKQDLVVARLIDVGVP